MNELMARMATGDEQAFNEFVEKHSSGIHGFFYKRTHCWSTAEDLTQECLLKIHRIAHKYTGNGTAKKWVYTIARNACVDFVRRERSRGAIRATASISDAYEDPAAVDSHSIGPCERAQAAEEIAIIMSRVGEMRPEQFDAVDRYCHGDSIPEIASDLKLCIPTVKSRIRLGREHIRRFVVRD